jgi:hypothetical protein
MENNGNLETQAPMAPNAAEGMPAPIESATAPLPEVPVTTAEVATAEPTPTEHKSIFDMIKNMFGGKKSATTPVPASPVVTTESAPAPFAPTTPSDLPKAA